MSGLVIKLAPRERILINGAVIENGDRRSRISILTKDASILRLRDAIHPEQAVTPVSRLCYLLQLALVGETDPRSTEREALPRLEELSQVFTDRDSRKLLDTGTQALLDGNLYRSLKALRELLPRERRLLALAGG